MRKVNIEEAQKNFIQLMDCVSQGEEILIEIDGKPIAKLIPIDNVPRRNFGFLKGKVKIFKDFDAALSENFD